MRPRSEAVTEGIRVEVRSGYLPERSSPEDGHYFFAYRIRITNEGDSPARLVSRSWRITDAHDVIVATTNASLFAYVADGRNGLKVIQLTSPDSQEKFYGFSPEPRPELIATYVTDEPALSLSRPLERDRGVDETGGQVAVFGRKGSRPLNKAEMDNLYLDDEGKPWYVEDVEDEGAEQDE